MVPLSLSNRYPLHLQSRGWMGTNKWGLTDISTEIDCLFSAVIYSGSPNNVASLAILLFIQSALTESSRGIMQSVNNADRLPSLGYQIKSSYLHTPRYCRIRLEVLPDYPAAKLSHWGFPTKYDI